jgi:MoaA/NifB/PqqE/SkfB family radical SAM enzyme
MVRYAAEHNVGVEVSSHLNRLAPGQARELVASGLDVLIVSLDGADAETYRRYRVGGDFERVQRNLAAVLAARREQGSRQPLVEIQFLMMRHNEHQTAAMQDMAARLGVDRLVFGPVTINARNPEDHAWLPRREAHSRYTGADKRDRIYARRRVCEWLWRTAVINWDGTVSPCCVYEGPAADLGSLDTASFPEIWNGPGYQSARRVFAGNSAAAEAVPTICSFCRGKPRARDPEQHGLY